MHQTLSALTAPQITQRFIDFPFTQHPIIQKQAAFVNFPKVVGVKKCFNEPPRSDSEMPDNNRPRFNINSNSSVY